MSRRRDQKTETRADILFVARKLFIGHGYGAVTMRQVAKAAGRSTGAIFLNWAGKDELFTEAMGRPVFTDAMGERMWRTLQGIYGEDQAMDFARNPTAREAWES